MTEAAIDAMSERPSDSIGEPLPEFTTEFGVFARAFPAGPADDVARAIRRAGFTVTQLNLSALGRPTLDTTLTAEDAAAIRATFEGHGVRIWSLSATFNAIDPDFVARGRAITAAERLIGVAPATGAQVVTLCTGTRDPHNMWRAHPDNDNEGAWVDLRATLDRLLPHAAAAGIRLGIEPEHANVVRDAPSAARLLAELADQTAHVGIVLDPANLLTMETIADQRDILTAAFDLLGEHVVGLHAKDVSPTGFAAPGAGGLDYELVAALHTALPHAVPVIAQDLTPDQAPAVYAFLTRHWTRKPTSGQSVDT
jgi:sugar phosphate isomerase/epimerase